MISFHLDDLLKTYLSLTTITMGARDSAYGFGKRRGDTVQSTAVTIEEEDIFRDSQIPTLKNQS